MTIADFNNLTELEKVKLIIDAKKISESEDDVATHQTFQIYDFLVDVSISVTHRFRKIDKVYNLNAL